MFNPHPRVQVVPITSQHACYVIDDALLEPERWVEHALAHRAEFNDSPRNAFPGPELGLSQPVVERFSGYFAAHARSGLGGRRTLGANARLSIATRAPGELKPWQWFCHVDRLGIAPEHTIAASVLYLFDKPELGGTAFYVADRPQAEIDALVHASGTMAAEEFAARSGIAPGYMTASNAWFRKVASIPARWNRLIFYPGTVLHSGEILHPELLDGDPRKGRLTINGFFTCTRKATA